MRRDEIVQAARGWIGTPYCHQASLKGAGCDCLGLVRGLWRELVGEEPEIVPAYTPHWAESTGEESLLAGAARHLREVSVSAAQAGDVVLFRMGMGVPAKHCGVLTGEGTLVHAYWGRNVMETRLVDWWARRIVAAFAFPGVED